MKGAGMAVGNFELNPGLKETNLGVDYMNRVKRIENIQFFNISSSATLRETFTAKDKGDLPRTP